MAESSSSMLLYRANGGSSSSSSASTSPSSSLASSSAVPSLSASSQQQAAVLGTDGGMRVLEANNSLLAASSPSSLALPASTSTSPVSAGPKSTKDRIVYVLRLTGLIVLAASALTFVVLFFTTDDVQVGTMDALNWLRASYKDDPVLSTTLCAALYGVSLLFFIPGTPFNLAAGFLYGPWIGGVVAMTGACFGAFVAFFLGRSILRTWITEMVHAKYPKFKAIDLAVQKKGLLLVTLMRLSPVFPFPLLNYAFGITQVSFWQYSIGTFIGLAPFTLAYTYLGSLMRDLTEMWEDPAGSNDSVTIISISVGAVFTILSVIVISLITKRAIDKATTEFMNESSPLIPGDDVERARGILARRKQVSGESVPLLERAEL